jgi:hypothetical protein
MSFSCHSRRWALDTILIGLGVGWGPACALDRAGLSSEGGRLFSTNDGSAGAGGAAQGGSDGGMADGGGGSSGTGSGGSGGSGSGGSGGTGGFAADCTAFPQTHPFMPPTDGRLHCYWVHDDPLSWAASEERCRTEQGHLVTILSGAENAFVFGLIQFAGSDPRISIGATDDKPASDGSGPGTFRWITGEPWTYDNWTESQPDGICESCDQPGGCHCDHRGTIGPEGTWYDRWEGYLRPFVCEATR